MACERKGEWLTNRQIMMLGAAVSVKNMKKIANDHLGLSEDMIEMLTAEYKEDKEEFKRTVIKRWANMNSEDQVKNLATLMYQAADKGLVDPGKIEEILGLSKEEAEKVTITESDLNDLAGPLKEHAAKTTRIPMAPWAKAYKVGVEDIFTDLALDEIENQPTGPEPKRLDHYTDMFAEMKTHLEETKVNPSMSKDIPTKNVLLKSDPGMGKSTLGQKVTFDWATGIFSTFALVFFISLKLVQPGDAIENIIIQQTPALQGLGVTEKRLLSILEKFGNRSLIILDGFDELSEKNEEIMKLIMGGKLLYCNIVVTSRPHSVEDIEMYFQRIVKIQGFEKDDSKLYVSKVLRDKEKSPDVLIFNANNFVKAGETCTCPMLLLFICILVNADEIDLTRKNVPLGEIYWRIIRCIFSKYRVRKDWVFDNSTFIDVLKKISEIAYKIMRSRQAWFQRDEVLREVGQDAFDIGLLIGHEDFRLVGHESADIFITFPHNTILEFMGVFCAVRKFDDGKQYYSMYGREPSLFHFFLWLLTDTKIDIGFDTNAAYERLKTNILYSLDVATLDVTTLQLSLPLRDLYNTQDKVILETLETVLSKCQQVKHLVLSSHDPIRWILESLGHLVEHITSLQIVDTFYTSRFMTLDDVRRPFAGSGTTIVLDAESCNDIDEILEQCSGLGGYPTLIVGIFKDKEYIDISRLIRPEIGKLFIGDRFVSNKHLDLRQRCSIKVTTDIRKCPNLTHLSVTKTKIDLSTLEALSRAVQQGKLPKLSHLSFSGCEDEVAGKLFLLFKSPWPSLTHLNLNRCLLVVNDVEILHRRSILPELTSLVLCPGDERYEPDIIPSWNLGRVARKSESQRVLISTMLQSPLTNMRTLWLHDLRREEYKMLTETLKTGHLPNLTEFGVSMQKNVETYSLGPIKMRKVNAIENMDPISIPELPQLTQLTLHRFICVMHHLNMVTQSTALTKLHKLDISHSSGITGTLSILLRHSFPSLNSLILSDCGLNSQDLCSLAQAGAKGRLPEIRHLDISENKQNAHDLNSLLNSGCRWEHLLSLNIANCSNTCFPSLCSVVKSGCLSSLRKLRFSTSKNNLKCSDDVTWACLRDLQICSEAHNREEILLALRELVPKGMFPALHSVSVSAESGETLGKEEQCLQVFSQVFQQMFFLPLPVLQGLSVIGTNMIINFWNNFHKKLHQIPETFAQTVIAREETYNEILREFATEQANSVANSFRDQLTNSEHETLVNALRNGLMGFTPAFVGNPSEDIHGNPYNPRNILFITKHNMMERGVTLFMESSSEFTTGW